MHILVTAGVDRFANPGWQRGRFTMARQARQRPQSDVKQMVHRRCRVCEWEADLIEVLGTEGDCPWCHAPTAVSVVLPPAGGPDAAGDAKNPHAAMLGRLGGLKGGPARAARLTARERREGARRVALARWAKKPRPSSRRA